MKLLAEICLMSSNLYVSLYTTLKLILIVKGVGSDCTLVIVCKGVSPSTRISHIFKNLLSPTVPANRSSQVFLTNRNGTVK